jgi:hypothetical protein
LTNSSTPYRIRIGEGAWRNVQTPVPVQVRDDLREALRELAKSPTTLSRPSRLPFVPGEQCFECSFIYPPYRYFFHVSFKFSQDETSILIAHIGLSRTDLPGNQRWLRYS